jgi:hypothetical protein
MKSIFLISIIFSLLVCSTFAQNVVPVVAHANGANGSVWRSDLVIANDFLDDIEVHLTFQPLNYCDSDKDVLLKYTIAPFSALSLADVYALAYPNTNGAARILIDAADFSVPMSPIIQIFNYNEMSSGTKYYQVEQSFGLYTSFTYFHTYCAILGSSAQRTNIYVTTWPYGASIYWSHGNFTNDDVSIDYCPNSTTAYYDNASGIFGHKLPANEIICAVVLDPGGARIAYSTIDDQIHASWWGEFQIADPPN